MFGLYENLLKRCRCLRVTSTPTGFLCPLLFIYLFIVTCGLSVSESCVLRAESKWVIYTDSSGLRICFTSNTHSYVSSRVIIPPEYSDIRCFPHLDVLGVFCLFFFWLCKEMFLYLCCSLRFNVLWGERAVTVLFAFGGEMSCAVAVGKNKRRPLMGFWMWHEKIFDSIKGLWLA